jgi:hypothetical protein
MTILQAAVRFYSTYYYLSIPQYHQHPEGDTIACLHEKMAATDASFRLGLTHDPAFRYTARLLRNILHKECLFQQIQKLFRG